MKLMQELTEKVACRSDARRVEVLM